MRGSSPKICCVADEHFVPLWVERYVAALPPSHPLTLKDRLRTADLAGVAMIDRCHCEQSEFFGRAASASRQPAAIAESEDWAMALVAAGVGIAIVPEGVARANSDVAVREIDVDVKREVGLAYSAARPPSETLQNFIAKLQRQRPKAGRAKSAGRPGARTCTLKRRAMSEDSRHALDQFRSVTVAQCSLRATSLAFATPVGQP